MFSALDDDEVVAQSILAGASGYVVKQIRPGGIVNAVRKAAKGEVLFEDSLRKRVLECSDAGPEQQHRA
jgi:two-component system, NarL family, response regulator DevR